MKIVCAWCKAYLGEDGHGSNSLITHGMCPNCAKQFSRDTYENVNRFLDSFAEPILVVNSAGRVEGANRAAQRLVGKEMAQIQHLLGGNVFECEYSFLPEGCGQTAHCPGCAIRRAVMNCLSSGVGQEHVDASILQRVHGEVKRVRFKVSTERVGEFVLLRVDEVQ